MRLLDHIYAHKKPRQKRSDRADRADRAFIHAFIRKNPEQAEEILKEISKDMGVIK
jgi:hypothetical protein